MAHCGIFRHFAMTTFCNGVKNEHTHTKLKKESAYTLAQGHSKKTISTSSLQKQANACQIVSRVFTEKMHITKPIA